VLKVLKKGHFYLKQALRIDVVVPPNSKEQPTILEVTLFSLDFFFKGYSQMEWKSTKVDIVSIEAKT
jgi:hypothetical protein